MIGSRWWAGVTSAVVLVATAGCGNRNEDDAAQAATRFHHALARGDGSAACAVLSPTARATLAAAAHEPCAVAVLEEGIDRPGGLRSEAAFGTSAQIRYTRDTVFLGRFPDGWRVTAASCSERPDLPYDCRIEGG